MKTTLKDIATIRTGVFGKPENIGEIVYLQVKYFDENGQIIADLKPDLPQSEVKANHLLKPGDIIFAAKGSKNFAAVYEKHNPTAVASTSFFVICPKENQILPEYLVWFLNQPDTQKFLKNNSRGSDIASISKVVLENLEIPVPDLKKQQLILKISHLLQEEKSILQKIEFFRGNQIHSIIKNALK